MPTFFSRRYMRGRPPLTERLVGISVLLLAGSIVAVFLLTGGLLAGLVTRVPVLGKAKGFVGISEEPLFVGKASLPAPPRELRVAEAMFPVPAAPWKRVEVKVGQEAERDTVPDDLAKEAKLFGATSICCGRYWTGDRKGGLLACIVDTGDPAAAFGLCRARQPADSKPNVLGRSGWQREDGVGDVCAFWAGRYYTEISGTYKLNEFLELARAIAETQLVYGEPFWADSVLPADGRVASSFRYVKKSALGIEELADCWLAEYPGPVTLGVMRPASAERLLAALKARLQSGAAVSHEEGEKEASTSAPAADLSGIAGSLGAGVVAGRLGAVATLAFVAGPYVFVASGGDPAALEPLAKATYVRWSVAGTQGPGPAQASGEPARQAGKSVFGEVAGADLTAPTKIERYTDNLYEKIDGREGQYRAYGFVELKFAQYVDRQQQAFDVYVYDMGEALNAMGIFMAERSEDPEVLKVGRDGYISGPNVYFWKSKYYVNVLGPVEGGAAAGEVSKRIATHISDAITDDGKGIWAEGLLPREDKVAGSLSYRATSGLGHEFLQQLFLADYKTGDKMYQMFIARYPQPAAAKAIFGKFADATARFDKVLLREPSDGGEMLVGESGGVFTVAFSKGIYLGGVTECDDKALALQRATMMRERLQSTGAEAATSKPSEAGSGGSEREGG